MTVCGRSSTLGPEEVSLQCYLTTQKDLNYRGSQISLFFQWNEPQVSVEIMCSEKAFPWRTLVMLGESPGPDDS